MCIYVKAYYITKLAQITNLPGYLNMKSRDAIFILP